MRARIILLFRELQLGPIFFSTAALAILAAVVTGFWFKFSPSIISRIWMDMHRSPLSLFPIMFPVGVWFGLVTSLSFPGKKDRLAYVFGVTLVWLALMIIIWVLRMGQILENMAATPRAFERDVFAILSLLVVFASAGMTGVLRFSVLSKYPYRIFPVLLVGLALIPVTFVVFWLRSDPDWASRGLLDRNFLYFCGLFSVIAQVVVGVLLAFFLGRQFSNRIT